HGIFHEGTRFVSRWKLELSGTSPLLLSSDVREENDFLAVNLTNPALEVDGGRSIPHGALHLGRTQFLRNGGFFERIKLSNFDLERVPLTLELEYEADYVDLFEVRGNVRPRRGRTREATVAPNEVLLSYDGLDGQCRQTRIHFSVDPH